MKKVLYLILTLIVVSVSAVFVACGGDTKPHEEETKTEITISLSSEEIMLDRFEDATLTATITGTDQKAQWTSSDNNVATVDNGVVQVKGVGETTITATVSDKSDSCKVKVVDSGEVPVIKVTNTEITLSEGNTFQSDARVVYKNNEIEANLVFSSDNDEIATVSQTGLIKATGTSVGNVAKITISSEYMGYKLTDVVINVTTKENIAINIDKSNVELSSYAVENNQYPITETVDFSILSGEKELENPMVKVSYSEEGIASYDIKTKKVTAISKGYTRITLEYESEKGSNLQAYFDVDVYAPVIKDGKYDFNIDKNNTFTQFTLKDDMLNGNVISVIAESGENILESVSGDVVTLKKDKLVVGESKYKIEYSNRYYEVNTIVATRFLDTREDFDWFMNMLSTKASACPAGEDTKFATGEYYLLTNNVDCTGAKYSNWDQRGNFDGVFNGNGYTISNMDMPRQGFIRICTGTIKNVSFYNATYNKGSNAAMVCNELLETGKMENVLIHGKVTSEHSGSFAGLVNYLQGNCTLKNSIAFVDLTKVTGSAGSVFVTNRGKVTDCYGISSAPSHKENTGVFNGKSFSTFEEMKNDFTINKNQADSFDKSIWTIVNGVPVMESFVFSHNVVNDMKVEFVSENSQIKLSNNNDPFVKYYLKEAVQGVSIQGNILSVSNEAVVNSTINVVIESLFDADKKDVLTIVISVPFIDYSKSASVGDIVKNGGIGANSSILLSDINAIITEPDLTKEQITKISINNVQTEATIDNEKITILKENVASDINGYVNLDIHTEANIYRMKVMVVYANIASVKDFSDFFAMFGTEKGRNFCAGETVILSADIDCAPEFYKAQNTQPGGNKATFSGIFDGRGHAIKNINVGLSNNRRALFRVVNSGAVIKNLALIDTKVGFSTASFPASIASEMYGTVENCFVSGTNETSTNANVAGGIVNQINNMSVVRNCIAKVEFSGQATNNALIVGDIRTGRTGKEFSNCYGISSTATKMVGNEKDFNTKNLQAFANVNDFGVKVTSGLEGEGWSEYWQIKENALYFGNNLLIQFN